MKTKFKLKSWSLRRMKKGVAFLKNWGTSKVEQNLFKVNFVQKIYLENLENFKSTSIYSVMFQHVPFEFAVD